MTSASSDASATDSTAEPGFFGLLPGRRVGTQADPDIDTALGEVEGVGVPL